MPTTVTEAYRLLASECDAWAMAPAQVDALAVMLARGEKVAVRQTAATPQRSSTTAVIPIIGALTRRPSMLARLLGLGDSATYSGIRARLMEAVADRSVDRIALLVDSPGGVAMGVEELGNDIANANKTKPVISITDGMAGSAAYWLASQAGRFVATPSSEVGSVGVFGLHLDASRMVDAMGITPTFIVSKVSPFKVEGNEFEALDSEAKGYFQSRVDKIGSKFVAAVARGRGVTAAKVKSDFGQGRALFADDAQRAGMIDAVMTIDRAFSGRSNAKSEARAGASPRRRRLQILKAGSCI